MSVSFDDILVAFVAMSFVNELLLRVVPSGNSIADPLSSIKAREPFICKPLLSVLQKLRKKKA